MLAAGTGLHFVKADKPNISIRFFSSMRLALRQATKRVNGDTDHNAIETMSDAMCNIALSCIFQAMPMSVNVAFEPLGMCRSDCKWFNEAVMGGTLSDDLVVFGAVGRHRLFVVSWTKTTNIFGRT